MKKDWMIAVTGDKGGVGKSTLVALLAEWLLYQGRSVHIIDTDPNQTTQTWIDKCTNFGRTISSKDGGITIVDTAGTSGSSLTKYIRHADLILVPFKPHIADLEVIVGWFLSLKESLQSRVLFIPNMLSNTKEQKTGVAEISAVIKEETRGQLLPGLAERKAVYPTLLNGGKNNFFETNIDHKTREETQQLFTKITQLLSE
ncbi:MAG: ParA family protein [Xenococcaceae cyanobacterium MO_188.B19]|nr:ParA family protein [Xenococcaceae cyanobacterium MO_188.B19]